MPTSVGILLTFVFIGAIIQELPKGSTEQK
jgi:hypothetical protein